MEFTNSNEVLIDIDKKQANFFKSFKAYKKPLSLENLKNKKLPYKSLIKFKKKF